jgi:hypothetical protein
MATDIAFVFASISVKGLFILPFLLVIEETESVNLRVGIANGQMDVVDEAMDLEDVLLLLRDVTVRGLEVSYRDARVK